MFFQLFFEKSPTPRLVNNEAKPEIIPIRVIHLADNYEGIFECKWPYEKDILGKIAETINS